MYQQARRTTFLICSLISFLLLSLNLSAQLKANFTVDNPTGCSPLSVKFTNTTTGASSNVNWTWNLGNGNSSALFEPGAIYRTEQKYTVTLTAKDGANTSTKSVDITVYKKPTLDFSVSPSLGCIPLLVTFSANAIAGDGTIAQYLWDYGDGKTEQGISLQKALHTYTEAQNPPITLTVTNSFGCYSSLTKINQVDVSPEVKASFTPSVLSVCGAGDNVTFNNTSSGSGTLSYSWDFGDGKNSTDVSPTHAFASKGNFPVTLTTKSSNGCSVTTQPIIINVANFTSDFDIPLIPCQNSSLTFTNKSTKPFDKAEWTIDNDPTKYSSYNGDLTKTFSQAGVHTLTLTNYYGSCSVSSTKTFTINARPILNGFVADVKSACGVPVTVNFKDTTIDVTKWSWSMDYSSNSFSTIQNPSYNFTNGSASNIYLTVSNKEGCTSTISKYIYYGLPDIRIAVKNIDGSSYDSYDYTKCGNITIGVTATPDSLIKDVKWSFGDSTPISTQKSSIHTYTKDGDFYVSLVYTTINNCTGIVRYGPVKVILLPQFDVTVKGGTTICGNTPTVFSVTPIVSGWNYNWDFGPNSTGATDYGLVTVTKKFNKDTTYTVRLIATNNGCRDTVIKKDFINVLPPFPVIGPTINTCDGDRGEVTFNDESYKVQKWSWDFGDGTPAQAYTTYTPTLEHTYTKTGNYKVLLTTTYNNCTVKDTAFVGVLLKQNPVLSSTQSDACGSDAVNIKLSGYEVNPFASPYYSPYSIFAIQYADLTKANTSFNAATYSNWKTEVSGSINNLASGENQLRLITQSYGFGCYDTTNFIPLKIHGPQADFKIELHSGCFKDAVFFTDLSKVFSSVPIVKWEWTFGDGSTKTLTGSGSTNHTYTQPGNYFVKLKVTDADGCSYETDYNSHYITVGGPKADFSVYSSIAQNSYVIPPNTSVNFYNTSAFYDSYSSLKWIFSDSTTSTSSSQSFNFAKEGAYVVTLITKNSKTGCTDTVRKTITVRKVNSAFTYKVSYINNNSCPPVLVSFLSTSTNAERVSWDFGDGGIAANQKSVAHTYANSGIYKVVHYSYDFYNNVDSTEDFIEVKGPYALLRADKLSACKTLDVRLDAEVKYANNYTWDFGDGTLVPTADTFAVHTYQTPGIYTPALILTDVGGCSATSELTDKIVVDSLHINFTSSPTAICNTALVTFIPEVTSLSKSLLQTQLQYRWIIKEDDIADTIYTETASHIFSKIGNHSISLTVTSPYGCEEELTKTAFVKEGIKASINGIDKICRGETTTFTGTASPFSNSLTWKWIFGNGETSDKQNPPQQTYNIAGQKQVLLIADNGNCPDTARYFLQVNEHPVVTIAPDEPFVCLGKSQQLTASGGVNYVWPTSNIASITVSPVKDTYYPVIVTNAEGCTTKDSVLVKVISPFKLVTKTVLIACEGIPFQLQVSGADSYVWAPALNLNNAQIENPVLTTKTATTLSVVGYDKYNCFTDTAIINVQSSKPPIVNAGIDQDIIAGTSANLLATVSNTATQWSWQPTDYLSCTNCLSPISNPTSSIMYVLKASNADGCSATDTVRIQLICKSGLIYIPSAFTPNKDGLNERFAIHGSGIKSILHIIIYDRWGKVVFEKFNTNINDNNSSWDGTHNGQILSSGNYVYTIQLECEAGDIFNYKGGVILLR